MLLDLSIFTKTSTTHSYDICEHASIYGIKAEKIVDGWDVKLIKNKTEEAIDYIKQKKGPCFFEVITCRYLQHVGPGQGLDTESRNLTEIERWQKNDPLIKNEELFSDYKNIIIQEINDAIEFAERSEFPTEEHLYKDVL